MEAIDSFQGVYEPANITKRGSTKTYYPNGGASYGGGADEFDQSDDEQQVQVAGALDFDPDGGYDCESIALAGSCMYEHSMSDVITGNQLDLLC